jgi:DNA primase
MNVDRTYQNFKCWACGKAGDVFTFVMEKERVSFPEALELLARRANIQLKRGKADDGQSKARMFDVMLWAEDQFHQYLLKDPAAEPARKYVESRHLSPETVATYGIGYAPNSWDWIIRRARQHKISVDLLLKVGLVKQRDADGSPYDTFRDRVLFPIRDVRGRTVAFGGRILPASSPSAPGPKYYNSSDTPLFSKSENLYGLDRARDAGTREGYLAVVEGYTDVLMAHQLGVLPVVAPLGTALNEKHLAQLRKFAPKVILVFDADAGGEAGVDRALELFVSQEVDLAVAALPEGLDPCDLLVQQGADAFRAVLAAAVDALDFKLARVLTAERLRSLEGRGQAIDAVLHVLAALPDLPGQKAAMKKELTISRLALRAGVKEDTVWKRLGELRKDRQKKARAGEEAAPTPPGTGEPPPRKAPKVEKELMEVLLAEPGLVARARQALSPDMIEHPTVRRLLQALYDLHEEGEPPDVDHLRGRIPEPALIERAVRAQVEGQQKPHRAALLEDLIRNVQERLRTAQINALKSQLAGAADPLALLKQIRDQKNQRN